MSDSLSPPPPLLLRLFGSGHLFAPIPHKPVSWDAWNMEKPPPPRALLARSHAGPFPRAENLGRPRPLDPRLDDGLALSSRAGSGILGRPSAGRMVGAGSPQHLATTQGRYPLCGG